jgi:homoserine O-acetyltransferase
MDAIRSDPAWRGGDYAEEPAAGLRAAEDLLIIAGSAPLQMQKSLPTRDAADRYLADRQKADLAGLDANDLLYQVDASRNYDPSPNLGRITARVLWINSADDFINPPELGIAERLVSQMPNARFILIPISDATRGHGTHTQAAVWKNYLIDFLKQTEKGSSKTIAHGGR